MILANRFLHRARITVELLSPMMIASGQTQLSQDNDLIRDENGWPMLPGTSITGSLRNLIERAGLNVGSAFGHAGEENRLSDVFISNGLVHDRKNRVQEAQKASKQDPVLTLLGSDTPVLRNGVAIDVRGVAKETGVYDSTMTPAGTRFTFEVSLWAETSRSDDWQQLLSLFSHPLCSFGGGSRSGWGQFKLTGIKNIELDLTNPKEAKTFRALPKSLVETGSQFSQLNVDELSHSAKSLIPIKHHRLRLRSESGWRVGGGNIGFTNQNKAADLLPYSEAVIEWNNNVAKVIPHRPVLPGTSVKGAFSHRLEFHFRRLAGLWATDDLAEYRDTEVKHLLGWAQDKDAQQGHLWFNDSYVINPKASHRTRNKIDRLTGGTLDGALFSEERLHSDELVLEMFVDTEKLAALPDAVNKQIQQALDLTLRDLRNGRLAIGAGQNNGNGFFYEVQ